MFGPPGGGAMELHIYFDVDGTVTFPSLASGLVPVAQGLDPSFSPDTVVTPRESARYLATRRTPVASTPQWRDLSDDALWEWHRRTRDTEPDAERPLRSRLDLKIELATRLLARCALCPWDCRVDRLAGELGFCGLGRDAFYTKELLHFGEEAEIRPSHTIFLTGCSLRCVYCMTGDSVVAPRTGHRLVPAEMATRIAERAREGARSLSFVGGNPDQNVLPILEVLNACDTDLPVVWNSNLYGAVELMELLQGVVDIHVADLKYGNDRCARRHSSVPRYWETVTRNLRIAAGDARVLVRHLLLPGHHQCCTVPVLRWLAENLAGVPVNLMAQYRPDHLVLQGRRPELRRFTSLREVNEARELAGALGVTLVGHDPM
jgi:putative pyruvate formate lyase activating enzyme